MNNEPVAWMDEDENVVFEKCKAYPIPLYTHQYERPHNTVLVPCDKLAEMQAELDSLRKNLDIALMIVNKPELTDEEIEELAEQHLDMDWQTGVIEFARAILRKAQEK